MGMRCSLQEFIFADEYDGFNYGNAGLIYIRII